MSLQPAKRRSYSEAEVAGAVLNVKANAGFVKPVAERLGLNRKTLAGWVDGSRRADGAATRAVMLHKQEQNLLEGYLELAVAAQKSALAGLDKASPYQHTLISGISYDKYLLGTGRPTSRNETLRGRLVDPEGLRSLSARVLDVPGHALAGPVPQRRRGVSGRPAASQTSSKKRADQKRARTRSRKSGASYSVTAGSAVLTPTTSVLSEPFAGAVPSRGSTPESQDVRGE